MYLRAIGRKVRFSVCAGKCRRGGTSGEKEAYYAFVQNHSNENQFDLHANEPEGGTHFLMNGFAQRLVLTQRQKGTRKWPIEGCDVEERTRFSISFMTLAITKLKLIKIDRANHRALKIRYQQSYSLHCSRCFPCNPVARL